MIDEQTFQRVMTIYGKMSEAEMRLLARLAEECPPDTLIVELGTFTGRSAILMGLACGDPGRVHTIDNYKYANGVHKPDIPKNRVRARQHGVRGLHFYAGDTRQVPPSLENPLVGHARAVNTPRKQVGLLFVDSEHTPKQVAGELATWRQLMRSPGGIIAFHDVGHPKFQEYSHAVEEWVRANNLETHARCETLLAVKV